MPVSSTGVCIQMGRPSGGCHPVIVTKTARCRYSRGFHPTISSFSLVINLSSQRPGSVDLHDDYFFFLSPYQIVSLLLHMQICSKARPLSSFT